MHVCLHSFPRSLFYLYFKTFFVFPVLSSFKSSVLIIDFPIHFLSTSSKACFNILSFTRLRDPFGGKPKLFDQYNRHLKQSGPYF